MTFRDGFTQAFGAAPERVASAPGRVNLIGEHTDYNGGAVLPAGLNRRVHVALAQQTAPVLRINSTRFEGAVERPVGDPKRGDWTDYAVGALSKGEELGWLTGGVMLHIESDIPDGAGVSSSAALITAILKAAADLAQVSTTPIEIAKHARSVENDYIGMPCGIMDQMAVGLADHGKALALDTSDLTYEVLDIPHDWGFAVLHSGIRRELADGLYSARFEECREAAAQLHTDQLCRLDDAQTLALSDLPVTLQKRARHVLTEHQRTAQASAAMKTGDITSFARLMNDSHQSYANDFEASTPQIDALVNDALATGASGARLTGGGFGGCIVVLHPRQGLDAWLDVFLARHSSVWHVS
ncbi:MAG: galactokinase [Pseudomonadota bacterium]